MLQFDGVHANIVHVQIPEMPWAGIAFILSISENIAAEYHSMIFPIRFLPISLSD